MNFTPIPLDKTITEMGWSLRGQHGNSKRGVEHYACKLTERDVRDIRAGVYRTAAEAAKILGVHPQTINRIKRRERWAHVK